MLLGPGGVVALMVGAWGALWCLRVGAGHDARAHWPPLLAFAAVIAAFSLLSALTEPISLMGHVLAHGPEADEAAAHVGVVAGASARGALAGLLVLGAGALGSRFDEPGPERAADVAEGYLAVSSAAVLLVASAAVLLLSPQVAATEPDVWLRSRRGFAVASWFGTASVLASLALASATGLRRALRRGP